MADKYRALSESRSSIYGDPRQSHEAIGLAWEGLFRNRYQEGGIFKPGTMFPSDLVALMLAVFKSVRAARPTFHQDSYDDNHVYLNYSEQFRKENTDAPDHEGWPAPGPGAAQAGDQERLPGSWADTEGPTPGAGDPGRGGRGGR